MFSSCIIMSQLNQSSFKIFRLGPVTARCWCWLLLQARLLLAAHQHNYICRSASCHDQRDGIFRRQSQCKCALKDFFDIRSFWKSKSILAHLPETEEKKTFTEKIKKKHWFFQTSLPCKQVLPPTQPQKSEHQDTCELQLTKEWKPQVEFFPCHRIVQGEKFLDLSSTFRGDGERVGIDKGNFSKTSYFGLRCNE